MNLEYLEPCRKGHAVKEASLTVFLNSPLKNFKSFESLLDEDLRDLFQRFDVVSSQSVRVNFTRQKSITENLDVIENGFKFTHYENGKAVRVFQGINEENRTYITFQELNYIRWNDFNLLFQKCFSSLSKKGGIIAKAFSLHYIDEFHWNNENDIPYRKIFNKENEVIPEYFLEAKSIDYLLSRNIEDKKNKVELVERLQINGVNTRKSRGSRLMLSHNLSEILNIESEITQFIDSEGFCEKIDYVHKLNKKLLKKLFVQEILDKINYNG
ncbi:MAG: TIGR04255 family protein [Putridiphycobacter sp.]